MHENITKQDRNNLNEPQKKHNLLNSSRICLCQEQTDGRAHEHIKTRVLFKQSGLFMSISLNIYRYGLSSNQ